MVHSDVYLAPVDSMNWTENRKGAGNKETRWEVMRVSTNIVGKKGGNARAMNVVKNGHDLESMISWKSKMTPRLSLDKGEWVDAR